MKFINNRSIVFVFICLFAVVISIFIGPIPQDLSYHNFADQQTLFGIPNFSNVLSNIFFLIVGIWGIVSLKRKKWKGLDTPAYSAYFVFFLGVALSGIGSVYYHIKPNNSSLVWDRIPMALTFMAFFSTIIWENVNEKMGRILFIPLLVLGIASVIYWQLSENMGMGDLRLYGLVQFLPLLLIPYILLFFPSTFNRSSDIYLVLFLYLLAKIAEYFDLEIYHLGNGLSGHGLKHILAALAAYWVLRMLKLRRRGTAPSR
jgi:hypothetical protein